MNIEEAKKISLAEYLQSTGINPCKIQNGNFWYYSPFRNETEPSFKVNPDRNLWYDFGMGKGGNIIAFVLEHQGIDNISQALQIISGKASGIKSDSFSFRPLKSLQSFDEITVHSLTHTALEQYLKERNINLSFAEQECVEVHFSTNGKRYFAIGFENELGGFEIRNKYFQGCLSPKAVTNIKNGKDECCIFEGFIDYLSYLTLKAKHNHEQPDIKKERDYIILNSVANLSKALDIIESYKKVICFLDNDKAGYETYLKISNRCGLNVTDQSGYYRGYKDLNDFLCGKKLLIEKKKSKGFKL